MRELVQQHRSTLIFVNARRLAERLATRLNELHWEGQNRGDEQDGTPPEQDELVMAHHGSLARERRLQIEDALKSGRLKGLVATSSLDLGVDFSPVDRVLQIGSPKGVARLLQRAGRSGHRPGAVSRVTCVPTLALELIEVAAARDGIAAGAVEARLPVERPLDVLVQHIAIRPGDDPDGPNLHSRDAVKILGTKDRVNNVVFDHCSLSWAIDEVVEVWGDGWDNVTLSNNIISEPLRDAPAAAGKDQGYAVLVDATRGRISFIGNLFAHAHNRSPRSAAGQFVFSNNVVYNAGVTQLNLFNKGGVASSNSIVGNVFLEGSDTTADMPVLLNGKGVAGQTAIQAGTEVYLSDNVASVASSDPWSIVRNESDFSMDALKVSSAPVWLPGYDALPAEGDAVLEHVMANAGSRPGERNPVDARVIREVQDGTGQIINCVGTDGSSRCSKNAGGWPELATSTRELTIPAEPDGDDDGDGYSNVEEWLQELAAQVEGRAGIRAEAPDRAPPKPPVLH